MKRIKAGVMDAKAGIEAHLERDRQRVLKELGQRFSELRTAPPTWPPSA